MTPDLNSPSYHSYRENLVKLAQRNRLQILRYYPYPEYPELQTVFIYNSALETSSSAFIHLSGTHGIEGYLGAEIQSALLENHGDFIAQQSQGILIVFAVNPFGFHFLRRASLENIDLNRNIGDGIEPPPWDPQQRFLRPLWRSHTLQEQLRGLLQGLTLGGLRGFSWVVRAFAEGQTVEDKGLFYSGQQTALEIKALLQYLRPFVAKKTQLFMIDVHSGLGTLFDEMLIPCAGDAQHLSVLFQKKLDVPGSTPSSYRGHGLLADRIQLSFPHLELTYLLQEFGIKSTAHSLLALTLENQYHWANWKKLKDPLYLKHPSKIFLKDTFFSGNSKWQEWARQQGSARFLDWLNYGSPQRGVSTP